MDQPHFEQLAQEALDAIAGEDYLRALAIGDQLVAMAPNDSSARAIRAEILLRSDNTLEALAEARQAVKLNPGNERAHTLLGLAAWRSSRLALAQQSLESAIKLSGSRPGLLADYAWFMASERGPRLAEDAALEAVAANDRSSTAWAALGLAQFRLHLQTDAEASLRRALELDPDDPYAQSAMAMLLHDQRKDTSAVALTRLLEDTPGTEEIVDDIRREAKMRQVERMVVERNIYRAGRRREARPPFWLPIMIILGALGVLFVLVQLVLVWVVRQEGLP